MEGPEPAPSTIAASMPTTALLQLLIDHHGGGPVGLDTLAAALGDDPVTLETEVEPFLLQHGLLMRTPRGRKVTDAARSHLAEAA